MNLSETLDWTKLVNDVVPNNKKIPFESNKHLFKKVAFDIWSPSNSKFESLWILEDGEDGEQYLVAQYDNEEPNTIKVKSNWEALADSKGENVTLIYKDAPIQRFAAAKYGFSKDDVHLFQQMLIEKLSSDDTFLAKLLKTKSQKEIEILTQQFPELK